MKCCDRFAFPAILALLLSGSLLSPAAAQHEILTVTVDGIERTAWVDPGKNATTTPSPLVFAFHGGVPGAGGATNMAARGLSQAWPEATTVYPLSLEPHSGFDFANVWQYLPGENGDRDVRFVDALLRALTAAYKVDERRVFVTGFSDGAAMTYLLLTMRPERFAAFAPVSIWPAPHLKWATVPRPVLITQGTADPGVFPEWAEWARNQVQRLDGCGGDARDWAQGSVSYQPCTSGQPVIYSLHSGGHMWTASMPITGNIVRFFKEQALPATLAASSPSGELSTNGSVAGSGRAGFSGDGGSATDGQLFFPEGIAVDGSGGFFIADTGNLRVRKVNLQGTISTVAGTGGFGFNPVTRASQANVFWPEGLAVDLQGNLFVADTFDRLVRMVTPEGIIRTVAGRETQDVSRISFSGDGGSATSAELSFPTGLAVNAAGNLFIADTENHRVREVGADGNITTIAGTGTAGHSGDGGAAVEAQLNEPRGLALDRGGNLYIADAANHRVRKLAPNGMITTIAGTGLRGFSGDEAAATAAQLDRPLGLAVDSHDNLFIVDSLNFRVRRVAPDGTITTVFGAGAGDSGAALPTPRYYPAGIAIDRAGNLLIADAFNHRIWKVSGVAAPGLIAGQPLPNP